MSALPRALAHALAIAGLALATAWASAAPARADIFSPIELVSAGTLGGGPTEQAEYAHDSVISSNGAFVVFDGAVGGETGVWRVDRATRQIQQVAGGDALLPSVSAGGRYVSFTTNQTEPHLVAGTRGLEGEAPAGGATGAAGAENVYVRDMELPPSVPGAFTVASAANGSSEPLTYAEAGTALGSVASGGAAISADGKEVAFVTTAISNLAGPSTPALQVAVRRLDTEETILVSGKFNPATGETTDVPVWAGGRGAAYADQYPFPEQVPEYSRWIELRPPGAAISADGSTVAWMAVNVGMQARTLADEAPLSEYTEPLWRRIAAPETTTERITGGSDPANPACVQSGEASLPAKPSASDPCQGPFLTHPEEAEAGSGDSGIWSDRGEAKTSVGDFVPRLSADGYTVAFLSRAEPIGLGEFFNQQREIGEQADVYVADMHAGLTRDAALTQLTRIGGVAGAESAGVNEFALSENGQDVAFTTRRTQFRLASPALVSAPAAEPGLDELFYVDLANGTVTRLSHGYDGEPSEQPHGRKQRETEDVYFEHPTAGATSPSFADEGALVAFSSTASNLATDDGNGPSNFSESVGPRDGSDAFLLSRETPSPLPTPQYVLPPPSVNTEPAWLLGASALARRDGTVLLYVRVPGAGSITASARSAVVVATPTRSHRRGRGATRASVALRTIASDRMSVVGGGSRLLTLVLHAQKPYLAFVARAGGLTATVTVSFAAAGHPQLRRSLQVTFIAARGSSRQGARRAGSSRKRQHR
jgi:hypothetical protein